MNKEKKEIKDSDIDNAHKALKRAAARAREIAKRTRTPLIIYRDGRVVKEKVE